MCIRDRLNREVTDQFGENPEQIPFVWRIQVGRPQVYYNVAVRIIAEVRKGNYKNEEFLPTPAVLAEKYGVSMISIRTVSYTHLPALPPLSLITADKST